MVSKIFYVSLCLIIGNSLLTHIRNVRYESYAYDMELYCAHT